MAIHDERRLRFGLDAIQICLQREGGITQALNLPSGSGLQRAVLAPETQTIEAQFVVLESGRPRTVSARLTSAQIAALLIDYCAHLRIPLPRSTKKRIVVESTCVTITFAHTIDVAGQTWEQGTTV